MAFFSPFLRAIQTLSLSISLAAFLSPHLNTALCAVQGQTFFLLSFFFFFALYFNHPPSSFRFLIEL